ncbi:hypothetical protein E4U61_004668 [Claviceps capensis]|nr:hypothetical protein E4U61_004668 [Claviceps capensis]
MKAQCQDCLDTPSKRTRMLNEPSRELRLPGSDSQFAVAGRLAQRLYHAHKFERVPVNIVSWELKTSVLAFYLRKHSHKADKQQERVIMGIYMVFDVVRRSYEQPDVIKSPIGIDSSSIDVPLYGFEKLPGKGRGLIARICIPKGTRILVEKPLLLLVVASHSTTAMEKDIEARLRQLSKKEVR